LGLTQEDVAEKLGISPAFYCHIENGNKNTSVDLLFRISEFYNVSVDYILCGVKFDSGTQGKLIHKITHRVNEFSEREQTLVLDFVNSLKRYAK
jgi:transcriptional regulator with XRE-family HTH domain